MWRFIVFLMILPIFSDAQSIATKADELLKAYTQQEKFSGNVLIAQNGKIIFQKAYGFADRDHKILNTIQTEFRAGSLTKMFTSTAVFQLQEKGLLSLADPVSKYLPSFKNGDHIKISDLLSHTSGIKGSPAQGAPSLKSYVKAFKSDSLAGNPGERFEYNNFNYILLSYIIQKVTGANYTEWISQHVLMPAGMNHSGLDFPGRKSAKEALGYELDPSNGTWRHQDDQDVAMAAGAGALYTTIGDLYKWSRSISEKKLMSGVDYKMAQTPVKGNYGMGWMIENKEGLTWVGHTGSITGFVAWFAYYPKQDMTIIFLSNYKDINANQLIHDLTAVAFNKPYELPVQRKVVQLSTEELQKYAGVYQMENGFTITVSVENGKLFALPQGDPDKTEFTPIGNNKFFLKGIETEIEFKEEKGKVAYLLIQMHGLQKLVRVG